MSGNEIPYGYCQCGCGQLTTIPTKNCTATGRERGVPVRFRPGHNTNAAQARGENNPSWKGGRISVKEGYIWVKQPDHRSAMANGYIQEHILIVENFLGVKLPKGAVIHHKNGIKNDNRIENLVVCKDAYEHQKFHREMRATAAGFPSNWRTCDVCKQWDDPDNLSIKSNRCYHKACAAKDSRERKAKKRGNE